MRIARFTALFLVLGSLTSTGSKAEGEKVIAVSGKSKVALVELFSSESCSSCPPADKWISGLETHKDLWSKFVPVVFHVDYWNHLNWEDGFSSSEMTNRQVAVSKTWPTASVYTPAMVVNGAEWRGWRDSSLEKRLPSAPSGLSLEILQSSNGQFSVRVLGKKTGVQYVVHLAKLGIGLSSKITSGENSGKTLGHSFVVLDWQQQKIGSSERTAPVSFSNKKDAAKKYAIAAWIEESSKPVALQAVGAFL